MYLLKKIFFIAVLYGFCLSNVSYADTSTEEASFSFVKPNVRMNAPDFLLQGVNEKEIALNQFSGKIVLLNFWATWCASCREEMPEMEKLWKKLREKGVVIIAVSADRNKTAVKDFVEKHGITFPVLYDVDGNARNKYEVSDFPTSYIIGRDGKFTAKIIGTEFWMSEQGYRFLLDEL